MYKNAFLSVLMILFLTVMTVSAQEVQDEEALIQLGKKIFFDNIASPDRQSCASCHAPISGFTGPIPGINLISAVYPGAVPMRSGNRKPPSAAYATLSPVFHYDEEEGLFVGGNFWDGRATGDVLGNPAADQALGPFLNPVEQNNPSKQAVLEQIADSKYADLWEKAWGVPIDFGNINESYGRIGLAIAAYEASSDVNQFTSKFDYYLIGEEELTEQEATGLKLFNDEEKGKCALCHISEPGPNGEPPLFTDFTFDNLGVPKNPGNPFYDMDEVYLDNGDPINPEGADWVDPGLGGFLENHPKSEWQALATENMGKHKVPTLRNVAKAPKDKFIKAYMHNGVFKSLEEVVHFYNTRDVEDWPDPEVAENVNTEELGDLGLTDVEEAAIVAFMKTLSDGYDPVKDKVKVKSEANLNITGANPFNPTTRFTYSLPEAADIKIQVYNAIGQRVATLVNNHQPAGTYQVDFNASHLASGVYFVHFSTQNVVVTKKISLIK